MTAYDMHAAMGWPDSALVLFIGSNLTVAACYYALAWMHLHTPAQEGEQRIWHLLYAAFIGSCGFGHIAMAVHMWIHASPWLMTVTHALTAIVSMWTVIVAMAGARDDDKLDSGTDYE